jgi:hypothetical protein
VVAVRRSISHPQSSLYIPASAKSWKRTAKNSRRFRTPSRYPQKKPKKFSKGRSPTVPYSLSKHSPLYHSARISHP